MSARSNGRSFPGSRWKQAGMKRKARHLGSRRALRFDRLAERTLLNADFSIQDQFFGSNGFGDGKLVTIIDGLAQGPDGNLWFVGNHEFEAPMVPSAFGRVSTSLAPVSLDALPAPAGGYFNFPPTQSVVRGPDGNID